MFKAATKLLLEHLASDSIGSQPFHNNEYTNKWKGLLVLTSYEVWTTLLL
jgi:hypothetical protein